MSISSIPSSLCLSVRSSMHTIPLLSLTLQLFSTKNGKEINQEILISGIKWSATQVFFFFVRWANLISPSLRKTKTMETPWNRRYYFEVFPPFGPPNIGERRITFAKSYGIKVRCRGGHDGEHVGNWGTYWEPDESRSRN
jgi:hypothetical protein